MRGMKLKVKTTAEITRIMVLKPDKNILFESLTRKAHFHSESRWKTSLDSVMTMTKSFTASSINSLLWGKVIMMRFSEPLRLMPERLFCQSFLGIYHMWLQICKKNLHSTKQLNRNQVSQLDTEWFNATRSQSRKRQISPGDCWWNQPRRNLAG